MLVQQFVNKTFTQAVYVAVVKKGGLFHHPLSLLSTVFKRINGGEREQNVLIS